MTRIGSTCLGMLLCAFATVASAATHPDFSGRWKMLKDQSDFGKFTRPDIVIRVIDHHDPTLNLHTVETTGGKTSVADISYFTDGSEATNNRSGHSATSKAFWDGAALMIRTDTTDSTNERVQILERWELSPDGQELVTTSDVITPTGGAHLKLVCQKEATK
jgi:hypothetical protein